MIKKGNDRMKAQQIQKLTKKHLTKKAFTDTIKYISKDEIKRLINSIDNARDKIIIKMLYSSGCRVGELVKACVDDIDFNECVWHIHAQNTKSKRSRSPRLYGGVVNDLKAYLKVSNISKGLLFPIGIRSIQRIVKKYGDKVGIKCLHPHSLRHTHIVHSLMDGVAMSAVQKQVGHVDLRTTQIYSNLAVSDVKKAYEKVEF